MIVTPATKCINASEILIPVGKPGAENGPPMDIARKTHPITENTRIGFSEYFDIIQRSRAATMPGKIELMTTGNKVRGSPPDTRMVSLIIPVLFEIK